MKDTAVGSHFAVRAGKDVIAVTLVGAYFDDIAEWRDLVASKTQRLRSLDST